MFWAPILLEVVQKSDGGIVHKIDKSLPLQRCRRAMKEVGDRRVPFSGEVDDDDEGMSGGGDRGDVDGLCTSCWSSK